MGTEATTSPTAVILFDGVCNLCNESVLFVIDRDPAGYFGFAALQSERAAQLLAGHPDVEPDLNSMILLENGRCYTHSAAALRTARRLTGLWPLLYALLLVPRPVRDMVYRWVARNRYRWFGRTEQCRVPTADLVPRFLS